MKQSRQTPKVNSVYENSDADGNRGELVTYIECPRCGEELDINDQEEKCCACGRLIDWSTEEE